MATKFSYPGCVGRNDKWMHGEPDNIPSFSGRQSKNSYFNDDRDYVLQKSSLTHDYMDKTRCLTGELQR